MTPYQLLLSTLKIAEIHEIRLREALDCLQKVLPINEQKLESLTKEENAFFVISVRYAKLQDLIGSKIFTLLLEVMAEPIESKRYLDMLAHLEKIGILESMDFWINLRNVRNLVAHEYPDQPHLLVDNINYLYRCALELLGFWENLKKEIHLLGPNLNCE
jgi:hypothetical protein